MMNIAIKSHKTLLLVLVFSILSVLNAGSSCAQAAETDPAAARNNPVFSARDSILSYFHPVSGVISEVQGKTATINLNSERRYRKGTRLSVLREGKPFYHPVTKQPFGRSEEYIGLLEIEAPRDGTYDCRILDGVPASGDIVRISSSPVKVAFFQDKKAEWSISELFYNSLRDTGRFVFADSYAQTDDLQELSGLARDLGAEALIIFSTPVQDKNISINAKLIWAKDAEEFAVINEVMGPSLIGELMSEKEFLPAVSASGLPWETYELSGGKFIAMGDVDGNGDKELVVSDGHDIRIYSYKKEPQEIWSIKGNPADEHLSVDVLDINGNGRAEIFVTSMKNEDVMNSFVIEFDPAAGYKKIAEKLPYALRAVNKNLLMQSFYSNKGLTGTVFTGIWRDNSYMTDKTFSLPAGVDIYGFAPVDWHRNGGQQMIAFDDRGYLNLYNKDQLIWKSRDSYGKFDIEFRKKAFSIVNPDEKWYVKGRLVTVNTGRGQELLAIRKMPVVAQVPGLGAKKAEAVSLWWNGSTMEETPVMSGISGAVTDYLVYENKLMIIAKPG
ncbi:MAG: VCBS repeat-containing protein, partial [Nitrospirae bacterium]|nr:VCBS repeat-containing protein [Nitrospirota bacterium]